MLEGSVQMGLFAQLVHHNLEMRVINVRIHSEQSLEYLLGDRMEILWKRHANFGGEDRLVVQ